MSSQIFAVRRESRRPAARISGKRSIKAICRGMSISIKGHTGGHDVHRLTRGRRCCRPNAVPHGAPVAREPLLLDKTHQAITQPTRPRPSPPSRRDFHSMGCVRRQLVSRHLPRGHRTPRRRVRRCRVGLLFRCRTGTGSFTEHAVRRGLAPTRLSRHRGFGRSGQVPVRLRCMVLRRLS